MYNYSKLSKEMFLKLCFQIMQMGKDVTNQMFLCFWQPNERAEDLTFGLWFIKLKIIFVYFHSTRLQQIATGDYLTRIFSNLVRFGGHDRQLSGGSEGWHGKKGGSMNIETYATVQFWDILFYWAGMFKILWS